MLADSKSWANQAANGVYTTAQRTALDTEADALTTEYNRIVQSTTFNGVNLFDGTFATIGVQAGSSHFTVDGANLNISVVTGGLERLRRLRH